MFPGARSKPKQPLLHLQHDDCYSDKRYYTGTFHTLLYCYSLSLGNLKNLPSLLDQGLPDQVEDMCPLLPSLGQALREVEELAGAGAHQAHYIHVAEVTLPMLCSYISHWWNLGPEGQPERPVCTSVVPKHASDLLGNILCIIHNHVGASQGDWMKQLAGTCVVDNSGLLFRYTYFILVSNAYFPTSVIYIS